MSVDKVTILDVAIPGGTDHTYGVEAARQKQKGRNRIQLETGEKRVRN